MSDSNVVKDIMMDVFDFPHIPYWFSIRQAIGIIKKSLLTKEKCIQPMEILVFDEKYNLVGTVSFKNILRGLEPRFLKTTTKAQGLVSDDSGLSLLWDTMFSKESKELAEKPISEIMTPAKNFVAPDDPVTKAAYLMVHNEIALLPVLENNKKFVGLVRMIEVFDELSNTILEGRG